ncbi:ORF40 [Streptococcus phage 7201]|uniref:ORF40 n=1 Tax=Streptococcus phage 7201 TaxID=2905727 RepID=Q9MCJ4_9CAUD|nr:ORF40 [Streptococcus phage 7201]AAF43532.1 ORF40 [Streptococcus phage 7201]
MKFEYDSKSKEYDASGAAYATKVVLRNRDGAYVPVFLPAEKIDLSNTELLNAALEVIYQENFPQRAETEKFNELNALTEKANQSITKIEEQFKEAQVTLMNIIDKFHEKNVLTDDDLNTLSSEDTKKG